jgi:hypothetical protein
VFFHFTLKTRNNKHLQQPSTRDHVHLELTQETKHLQWYKHDSHIIIKFIMMKEEKTKPNITDMSPSLHLPSCLSFLPYWYFMVWFVFHSVELTNVPLLFTTRIFAVPPTARSLQVQQQLRSIWLTFQHPVITVWN